MQETKMIFFFLLVTVILETTALSYVDAILLMDFKRLQTS